MLPFRNPPHKPAVVALPSVPSRVHHAVISHSTPRQGLWNGAAYRLPAVGSAQSVGDVEKSIYGNLDTDAAAASKHPRSGLRRCRWRGRKRKRLELAESREQTAQPR